MTVPGQPTTQLHLLRVGSDGRVRWMSEGTAALGCPALELGAPIADAFVTRAEGEALLSRLRDGGTPLAGERLAFAGRDGAPVPVLAWTTPGDEPTLAVAPAVVRVRGEHLATLLDELPVGVGVTDVQGRVLSLNPAGLRLHGFASQAEMFATLEQYRQVFELRDPDGRVLTVDEWPLSRAMRGEPVQDQEVRLRRLDGSDERVISYSVVRRHGERGEATALIFVMHDVTARRRAEASLHASQEQYRTLFSSIDEGFCLIDVLFDERGPFDYRFVEVNPAFERHTGLVNAEGKTVLELVPGHDLFWFTKYGAVAATGEPTRFESYASAMNRWFDVYALRVGGTDSRRVAVLFTDVTAAKRSEEALRDSEERLRRTVDALRESSQRKDDFMAMLAHELRNPLAPIRYAAELLRAVPSPPPALERARSVIDRQVGHMARLIDDLLDVSRIRLGLIKLQQERLDLAHVVSQTAEDYRATLEAGGLTLVVSGVDLPAWIHGDRTRLAQLIGNLLHNAGSSPLRAGRSGYAWSGIRSITRW